MCKAEDALFHSFFLAVMGNFPPIVQHFCARAFGHPLQHVCVHVHSQIIAFHYSHKDMLSLFQRS